MTHRRRLPYGSIPRCRTASPRSPIFGFVVHHKWRLYGVLVAVDVVVTSLTVPISITLLTIVLELILYRWPAGRNSTTHPYMAILYCFVFTYLVGPICVFVSYLSQLIVAVIATIYYVIVIAVCQIVDVLSVRHVLCNRLTIHLLLHFQKKRKNTFFLTFYCINNGRNVIWIIFNYIISICISTCLWLIILYYTIDCLLNWTSLNLHSMSNIYIYSSTITILLVYSIIRYIIHLNIYCLLFSFKSIFSL